jgi:hypothetical protein
MMSCLKMATVQEKAIFVLWFLDRKSVVRTRTRCRYRSQCGEDAGSDRGILGYHIVKSLAVFCMERRRKMLPEHRRFF